MEGWAAAPGQCVWALPKHSFYEPQCWFDFALRLSFGLVGFLKPSDQHHLPDAVFTHGQQQWQDCFKSQRPGTGGVSVQLPDVRFGMLPPIFRIIECRIPRMSFGVYIMCAPLKRKLIFQGDTAYFSDWSGLFPIFLMLFSLISHLMTLLTWDVFFPKRQPISGKSNFCMVWWKSLIWHHCRK